jgi:hypothetical protein
MIWRSSLSARGFEVKPEILLGIFLRACFMTLMVFCVLLFLVGLFGPTEVLSNFEGGLI